MKSKKLLFIVSATSVLLLLWAFWPKASFEGKAVGEWFHLIVTKPNEVDGRAAFKTMGKKAVPYLTKQLRREPSWTQSVYAKYYPKLPPAIRKKLSPPIAQEMRRIIAINLLEQMGPDSLSAVPRLNELLHASLKSPVNPPILVLTQELSDGKKQRIVIPFTMPAPAARPPALKLSGVNPQPGISSPTLTLGTTVFSTNASSVAVVAGAAANPPVVIQSQALFLTGPTNVTTISSTNNSTRRHTGFLVKSEDERYLLLHAIKAIGDASPATLDALVSAAECKDSEVAELAVSILADFGPKAKSVLPRLEKLRNPAAWIAGLDSAIKAIQQEPSPSKN
jgi:hypothetical protein